MPRTDIYDDVSDDDFGDDYGEGFDDDDGFEDVLIPSRVDTNNNDVKLLHHAHQVAKGSEDVSKGEIFMLAVDAAEKILELELSLSITEAELTADQFVRYYLKGQDLSESVSRMIKVSEEEPVDGKKNYPLLAYDTLVILDGVMLISGVQVK